MDKDAPGIGVTGDVTAHELGLVRDLGPALWMGAGLLAVVLAAMYPPTHAIGSIGWAVAAMLAVASMSIPAWQRSHPEAFTRRILLVQAWISVVVIVLAQWLAGPKAPWGQLLLLSLVAAAFTQPPRRAAGFAVGTVLAAFAPLLYGAAHFPVMLWVIEASVWLLVTVIIVALVDRLHLRRVDLSIAEESARHQARIDELTGLLNRRAFEEALAQIVPADKRRERRATLLLLDLDRFKLINDRYGHLAGDACLRAVGDALRGSVRELDRCFRWGGDEFAVLLLDSTDEETAAVAARVVERVRDSAPLPDGSAPTLGRGQATLQSGMDAHDLLGAADRELLRNKANDARERGVRSLTGGRFAVQPVD